MNQQLNTLRLFPVGAFPLVPVACRDCENHVGEDCPTCDNHEAVLVDEVFAKDVVLDVHALAIHEAAVEAYVAALPPTAASWPPRCPTPAEHAEIAGMQVEYADALRRVLPLGRAA